MRRLAAVLGAAALVFPSPAGARHVDGHVFVDADGDGVRSAGEPGVPGVRVGWDSTHVTTTAAGGAYQADVPDTAGILWIRVPEGYRPGPVWSALPESTEARAVDLALVPSGWKGPVTFVVGSDSHVGRDEYGEEDLIDGADLERSLRQALDAAPLFFVITGDMTQASKPQQFAAVAGAAARVGVPFVPVAGNHDWYEGGKGYRAQFGPPMYSFDAGGGRFVVLNDNAPAEEWAAFLRADLADLPTGAKVLAFLHRPHADEELAAIRDPGVDYLFTGHWHSNATWDRGGMIEFNTQPIVRGGMDTTPAGYRVVTLDAGRLSVVEHTVVEKPGVAITFPLDGECVSGTSVSVIAAAELGATPVRLVASLDGQAPVELAFAGGWDHTAELPLGPGAHTVTVTVEGGGKGSATSSFSSCTPPKPRTIGEWPQFQGAPLHHGVATDVSFGAPLLTMWARPVGSHLHGGSPVVADGRVFVSLVDFAGADGGGVAAFAAGDGHPLWRARTGASVRSAPAVGGGFVVASAQDGVVHTFDAATGNEIWKLDLGEGLDDTLSVLYAPPLIVGQTVYVGVHRRFAALDLATGAVKWTAVPAPTEDTLASYAVVGLDGGVIVGAFARGRNGLVAFDARTGRELWRVADQESIGIDGSPVIGGGVVYLAGSLGTVVARDLATGKMRWSRALVPRSTSYDYAVIGTPVLARGLLFVPTQYDKLFALDAATGEVRWTLDAGPSQIHISHARVEARSFSSSPVFAGGTLWVGGADGFVRAVDPDSGRERWRLDVRAPIASGFAPAGGVLYLASYDGTLRAMIGDPSRLRASGACGCRVGGAEGADPTAALVLFLLFVSRRAAAARRGPAPRRSRRAS